MRAPVIFLSDGTDPSTSTNVAPTISGAFTSGVTTQGQTLTAISGTINGTPTPSLSWQWKRVGSATVVGTNSTYPETLADVGFQLTVTILVTNSLGTASATSAPTAVIASSASPFGILDFSDSTNSAHVATIGA